MPYPSRPNPSSHSPITPPPMPTRNRSFLRRCSSCAVCRMTLSPTAIVNQWSVGAEAVLGPTQVPPCWCTGNPASLTPYRQPPCTNLGLQQLSPPPRRIASTAPLSAIPEARRPGQPTPAGSAASAPSPRTLTLAGRAAGRKDLNSCPDRSYTPSLSVAWMRRLTRLRAYAVAHSPA